MKVSMFVATCAVASLSAFAAVADGLDLTVRDASGTAHSFSLADLDALPQTDFTTSTIWTDGAVEFSGVALSVLLQNAGADGVPVRMTALNDYAVEMPVDGIGEKFPIVATRMNGAEMSVRDKGPYWIVYPYDANIAYQSETAYARSVWQLVDLSVMN